MSSIPRVALPAVVVLGILSTVLSGCTTEPAPAPAGPSAAAVPSRPPTDPTALTCDDLLSEANETAYAAIGFVAIDGFAARQTAEKSPNVAFLDYGGALCQWGVPNTDSADVFGASEIDATAEAAQRARLTAEGYVVDVHHAADRYSMVREGDVESYYLFVGGFWFYGTSEAGVDSIRQNADVG